MLKTSEHLRTYSDMQQEVRRWSRRPIRQSQELRKTAQPLGLNPDRVERGYIFDLIRGDDSNAWAYIDSVNSEEVRSHLPKSALYDRISAELKSSVLPQSIVDSLREVHENIWDLRRSVESIQREWIKKIYLPVTRMARNDIPTIVDLHQYNISRVAKRNRIKAFNSFAHR